MARYEDTYETPKWRTFWLGVGFALLIGIGVVTVLLPELEDEPSEESVTSQDDIDTYDQNDKAPPQ
ncbi:MAG: hypothetical protein O7F08_03610 [Deltaproteobacteria bacterium]|nr:hypothetical protein [Deltaproteobacteria bacterium]